MTIEYIRDYVSKTNEILISRRYKNAHAKLKFQCQEGHCYKMSWSNFQKGVRCTKCAEHGFNPAKPAILYYLEVLHRCRYYYKIGVTGTSIPTRYSKSDRKKITILATWHYKKGQDARDEEQRIIEDFQDCLYNGRDTPLEGARGNAELFTENVLNIE